MCGMCSAQCPTYRLTRQEQESPRGRISLINAWSRGALTAEAIHQHLNNCLQCGQCEKMCPSGVPYNQLLNDFKAQSDWPARQKPRTRQTIQILRDNTYRTHFFRQLYRYQQWGLRKLGRITGMIKLMGLSAQEQSLPTLQAPQRLTTEHPPIGEEKGQVALFTGCVSRYVEQDVIFAAIGLLNRMGYRVHTPASTACCGALARHSGDETGYEADRKSNLDAYKDLQIEHILYIASGCGATLANYDAPEATFTELNQFLSDNWCDIGSTREDALDVLVHVPCTERNALKAGKGAMSLLSRLPQLKLQELHTSQTCCGAGGSHMLEPDTINDQLGQQLVADIKNEKADILVTTNTGCHMQLHRHLQQAGLDIPVLHPVVLLDQLINRI